MKKILFVLLLTGSLFAQYMNTNVDSVKAVGKWTNHYFGGMYIKTLIIVPDEQIKDSIDVAWSMNSPVDTTALFTNRIRVKGGEVIGFSFTQPIVRYIWTKVYSSTNRFRIFVLP